MREMRDTDKQHKKASGTEQMPQATHTQDKREEARIMPRFHPQWVLPELEEEEE